MDSTEKMARCWLTIFEFEFDVVHHARTEYHPVDKLSRLKIIGGAKRHWKTTFR